jgi:outer membrane protein insertion porin family
MDGVSRGYSLYYRVTDYGEYNVANYLTNSMGGGVQFGYPISDTQRIGLNLNFDNTDIDPGSLPSREIADFLASEGTVFDVFKAPSCMVKNYFKQRHVSNIWFFNRHNVASHHSGQRS